MFNFTDCFELLTLEQQMNFQYEFKKQRRGTVHETGFAYLSFTSPAGMLASAFDWGTTTHGDLYWSNVFDELKCVMDMFEYSFSNN